MNTVLENGIATDIVVAEMAEFVTFAMRCGMNVVAEMGVGNHPAGKNMSLRNPAIMRAIGEMESARFSHDGESLRVWDNQKPSRWFTIKMVAPKMGARR